MRSPPRISFNNRKAEGLAYFVAFIACIPAANWMVGHLGTVCVPDGPCLVPVLPWGPGGHPLMAPSGVLMIGLALVLRDLVQRRLGRTVALLSIVAGATLSGAVAPPSLVLASAAAFFFSELADFAVYTPLQARGLVLAVLASSVVGLIIDSVLFLWLAFGSLEFLAGQIVGKMWMVLFALPVVHWIRKRELST
jgi:queuosine precursor transporter